MNIQAWLYLVMIFLGVLFIGGLIADWLSRLSKRKQSRAEKMGMGKVTLEDVRAAQQLEKK